MKRISYLIIFLLWLLALTLQGQTLQKNTGVPHHDTIPNDDLISQTYSPEIVYSIADQALAFWNRAESTWSMIKTVVSRGDLVIQDLSLVDPENGDTLLLKRGNVWHKIVVDSLLAGGGGSGLSFVTTNTTLTGNGTAGDPLGLAPAGVGAIHIAGNAVALGNMQTGSVSTDEVVDGSLLAQDFAPGATDDADADPTNEAQTITKVLNQIILSQAGGAGGGSVIDEVDDADADPTNEYNSTLNLNGNILELTDGGGTLTQDLSSLGGGGSGDISSAADLTINTIPYASAAKELSDSPIKVDPTKNTVAIGADPSISSVDKLQVSNGNFRVTDGRIYATHAANGLTWLEFFNVNNIKIFDIKGAGTPSDAEFNLYNSSGDRRISLRGVAGLNIWYNDTDKSVQLSQNHFADTYFGAQSFAFNNPYSSEGSNLYDRSPADWFAINNYKSFTIPRGTSAQEPTSEIGRMRYSTSTNTFRVADDQGWNDLAYKSEIMTPAFAEAFTDGGFATYDLTTSQIVDDLTAGNLENFSHSAGVLTYTGTESGEFMVNYSLGISDISSGANEIIVRLRLNNSVLTNAGGECRTYVGANTLGAAITANCSSVAILNLDPGNDIRLELSSGGSPDVEVKTGAFTIRRIK